MAQVVHIGKEIEARVSQLNMSQSEFGAKIGVPQQNIRRIYEKSSIDTDRLTLICAALNFNFFELYCNLDSIKVVGNHNQLNQSGSHHNSNGGGNAGEVEMLQEQILQLKSQLKDKEHIINLLEGRK